MKLLDNAKPFGQSVHALDDGLPAQTQVSSLANLQLVLAALPGLSRLFGVDTHWGLRTPQAQAAMPDSSFQRALSEENTRAVRAIDLNQLARGKRPFGVDDVAACNQTRKSTEGALTLSPGECVHLCVETDAREVALSDPTSAIPQSINWANLSAINVASEAVSGVVALPPEFQYADLGICAPQVEELPCSPELVLLDESGEIQARLVKLRFETADTMASLMRYGALGAGGVSLLLCLLISARKKLKAPAVEVRPCYAASGPSYATTLDALGECESAYKDVSAPATGMVDVGAASFSTPQRPLEISEQHEQAGLQLSPLPLLPPRFTFAPSTPQQNNKAQQD